MFDISKVFFTADTHFGDLDIITYEKRPFTCVEQMESVLMKHWNGVVTNKDTVFVAGDVGIYGKDQLQKVIQGLNGRKILIKGNHDDHDSNWWIDCGFDMVSEFPIIFNDFFIISHKPPEYTNDTMPWAYIYGHVHGSELYQTVTKRSACVCVERWGYQPVELNRIVGLMKTKQ